MKFVLIMFFCISSYLAFSQDYPFSVRFCVTQLDSTTYAFDFIIKSPEKYVCYFNIFPRGKKLKINNETILIEHERTFNVKTFTDDTLFYDLNYFHTGGTTWDSSPVDPGIFIATLRPKEYTLCLRQIYEIEYLDKDVNIICKCDFYKSLNDIILLYSKVYYIQNDRFTDKMTGVTRHFRLRKGMKVEDGDVEVEKRYQKRNIRIYR